MTLKCPWCELSKNNGLDGLHQDSEDSRPAVDHGEVLGARFGALFKVFVDADADGDVFGVARLQGVVVGGVLELDEAAESGAADPDDVVSATATFAQSTCAVTETTIR